MISSGEVLAAIITATVTIAIAIIGLIWRVGVHNGEAAERYRDTSRRLARIEHHLGFWIPPEAE